ncbi:MAG TPA: cyclase family protein [Chloroflexota bacterium]|jgi:kynurenine formamidase
MTARSSLSAVAAALTEGHRLVDLSGEVRPGVMYPDGRYRWGEVRSGRRFELRQWISMGGHVQSFVDTGSHVGTHVDMPCHIHEGARAPDGKPLAAADMPLEVFFGEAVVVDVGGVGTVEPTHVAKARPGDIVLLWSRRSGREQPRVSTEAARFLADLPIRMVGVQNVVVPYDPHVVFLGKEGAPIPIVEELEHCEELRHERVLYFGLPMRVAHLEASWIRAVAFEPKE